MHTSKVKIEPVMKFLGSLFFFLAVVVIAVMLSSRWLASKAIESAVGARTEVESVTFDLPHSQIGLKGIKIHSPSGFKEPLLASIPEVSVRYNLKSLLDKTIHIEDVRVEVEEIQVERSNAGEFNLLQLGAIQSLLRRKPSAKTDDTARKRESKPAERVLSAPALKVRIDKVDFSLGKAEYVDNAQTPPQVKEFPLNRHVVLNDVTDPRQVTKQVVMEVMQRVGLGGFFQGKLESWGVPSDLVENVLGKFKLPFGGN